MVKFLSSFRFALVLIFLTALLVMAGTFLESSHDSHLLAEKWIYSHPFFQLLLAGYFINILLSALLRYPYKKRHIPFLITHLGLLMIISGIFIKTWFGVQGHMQLIEGSATNALIHPHIPALYVENRRGHTKSIPLKDLSLLEYYPHSEERYEFWKEKIDLPFLNMIKSSDGLITLSAENIKKESEKIVFSPYKLHEWIVYDKGFQGYAVQARIPAPTNDEKQIYENLVDNHLISELEQKILSPPLEIMRKASLSSLIDFPKATLNYLKGWLNAGTWLYEVPFPAKIDWKNVEEYKALYWISELFNEENFLKNLELQKWPLLHILKAIEDPHKQFQEWMKQIYVIHDQLPAPEIPLSKETSGRMLAAYLRLFSLHYSEIPKPNIPFEETYITLESPLSHKITPKPLPAKIEDARPGIVLNIGKETISLIYDPHKKGLKWPNKTGNYLFRYQPHIENLPYTLRAHRALDIKHPGSEQTASYECALTIQDKEGICTPVILKMNQVYETKDGYRFYLAGMGKIDSYGVKSIQLVVNKDPAKMVLTYPGGLLVAIGILLLFFGKNHSLRSESYD